ncbi:hypothetical protein BGZ65_010824, partial [Modicella reniformis]
SSKTGIESIKAAVTYKSERVIVSPQNSAFRVASKDGQTLAQINFCANNYLGLADPHCTLKEVPFICGTQIKTLSFQTHGIRLCNPKRFRYKNCDMTDLEARLQD